MNRNGALGGLMVENAFAAASVKSLVIFSYCLVNISLDFLHAMAPISLTPC